MKPLTIHQQGEAFFGHEGLTAEGLPTEFQKAFPDLSPKYIDDISLLAGLAAKRALKEEITLLTEEQRKDFAVIVGSAFGAIDSTILFDAQALEKGPNAVNPMDFPNTVANAAGSRIGIWLQLRGPNVTLTNGGTSLIDAIGFAWEGYNSGLFQRCLVGAVDKVPGFLKPLANPGGTNIPLKEGSCLLLASGEKNEESLFDVTDYFSLQLKPDFGFPGGFLNRYEGLWDGVEWLGFPKGTALESRFPRELSRYSPESSLGELGLGGLDSLKNFLSVDAAKGIVGTFSKPERKFSLIKVTKSKGAFKNGNKRD